MPASRKKAARTEDAPRIAIFAEPGDRPAKAIAAALEALGARACTVSLKICGIDSRVEHGLRIPGFEARLPDGAIVRNLPAGTFEQVTLRLGAILQGQGRYEEAGAVFRDMLARDPSDLEARRGERAA